MDDDDDDDEETLGDKGKKGLGLNPFKSKKNPLSFENDAFFIAQGQHAEAKSKPAAEPAYFDHLSAEQQAAFDATIEAEKAGKRAKDQADRDDRLAREAQQVCTRGLTANRLPIYRFRLGSEQLHS